MRDFQRPKNDVRGHQFLKKKGCLVQKRIPKQEMVGDGTTECMVITSGSLQYSLNNEGLLMQSSPTPVLSLPLSSSKRILAYQKPVNDRIFEVN